MSYNNDDYNAGWKGGSMAGRSKAQYMRGWDDRQTHINGGSTCFPANARVQTPSGWRQIGDLSPGDEVLGFDQRRKSISARKITKRLTHPATILWEIRTADVNRSILTTAGHLFLTNSGWRAAHELKAGDQLITVGEHLQRSLEIVAVVRETIHKQPVFNLYTVTDHTFIVEWCVVHNFAHLRILRTFLHRFFFDPLIDLSSHWPQLARR